MYCKDTCLSNDWLILFSLSIKLDYHSCTKYIHTLKKIRVYHVMEKFLYTPKLYCKYMKMSGCIVLAELCPFGVSAGLRQHTMSNCTL